MDLIRNNRKGKSQLESIHQSAIAKSDSVLAAVAYISAERPFLELCWKQKKKLTVWGRYDHTGPIAPAILDWFMARKLSNIELKLVPDRFHPKVIWWQGVGAYLGSANLSHAAWFQNFEAGMYLDEQELEDNDLLDDLQEFFDEIDAVSHGLTEELADEMKAACDRFGREDERIRKEFNKTRRLKELPSLISITKIPRKTHDGAAFLREWDATLEHLRTIAEHFDKPGSRPSWVPPEVRSGVVADQFLHAYYYNEVREGNGHPYHEFFERHKNDRLAALMGALDWWRKLPSSPGKEDLHMTVWAPELQQRLQPEKVKDMSESEFVEVCRRVHAMRDHAARLGSKAFGLTHDLKAMDREERVKFFAEWLYQQRSPSGQSPCELIDFVIYGGDTKDTPRRIFDACSDPDRKIPHMGVSTFGEIVGWAMPNKFPPRNGRTSKALRALGYDVKVHSG